MQDAYSEVQACLYCRLSHTAENDRGENRLRATPDLPIRVALSSILSYVFARKRYIQRKSEYTTFISDEFVISVAQNGSFFRGDTLTFVVKRLIVLAEHQISHFACEAWREVWSLSFSGLSHVSHLHSVSLCASGILPARSPR
jgi:hypothetical protein